VGELAKYFRDGPLPSFHCEQSESNVNQQKNTTVLPFSCFVGIFLRGCVMVIVFRAVESRWAVRSHKCSRQAITESMRHKKRTTSLSFTLF
jgi:hypothetical protein